MSTNTEPTHRILTIDEAADLLDVSPELLQRWVLTDFGPTVYVMGNGFRYRRDEVIEWKEKNWKRDRYLQAG
jgi:excisionase family DNA binding protein